MVGRRSFPFRFRPIFRGKPLVLGSVYQQTFWKLGVACSTSLERIGTPYPNPDDNLVVHDDMHSEHIYIYTRNPNLTLVLVWKGLVLGGWPSTIESIEVISVQYVQSTSLGNFGPNRGNDVRGFLRVKSEMQMIEGQIRDVGGWTNLLNQPIWKICNRQNGFIFPK